MSATLDDYRWLIGPGAAGWLSAGEEDVPLHSLVAKLRRELSPVRCHLVAEQIELRRRAAAKFPHADRMFFTRIGLEQATDHWVARYKASRFATGSTIIDLCCGIGGDLAALASRGPAIGVDRSPIAGLLAETNLQALVHRGKRTSRETVCADVRDSLARAAESDAWHIDPGRRAAGKRTTRITDCGPDFDVLESLRGTRPNGAIKLAPAAEVPASWQAECELEWISRDGECRQLVVWSGAPATSTGLHKATLVDSSETAARAIHSIVGRPSDPPAASRMGRYLFEPDAAVLAAKLQGHLAAEHKLAAIAPGIAYLTADHLANEPGLSAFEVKEVMPFQLRRIKAWLREGSIGRVEVKKRGVRHDPAALERQLRAAGDRRATLVVTKYAGKEVAILCRRLSCGG